MSVEYENISSKRERIQSDRLGMPTVANVVQANPTEFGLSHEQIYSCTMIDPYIEALDRLKPGRYEEIQRQEAEHAMMAQQRYANGDWHRNRGVAYDVNGNEVADTSKKVWGDPLLREQFTYFLEDGSQAHAAWLKKLPHASTLSYLSHPFAAKHIDSKVGGVEIPVIIGETLKEWWVSCSDAVGIRSRAGIMSALISDYANSSEDGLRTWTSVASGTAAPVLESATTLGLNPEMTLVDYDQTALDFAETTAKELGFGGSVNKLNYNIFDTEALKKLPRSQMIDLMGIFEYIGPELKTLGINIEPEEFLRANYDFLEPGGRLIFGQMRDDRPNSFFTMGVIGWPYIVQRSPKEVMGIINKAGIPDDEVSIYLPDDGVYGVYVIDKPQLKSV